MAGRPRVLLPTSRAHHRLVSFGPLLDLEDMVVASTDAELLHVPPVSRRRLVGEAIRGRRAYCRVVPPRDDYDLSFSVFMSAYGISALTLVRELRARARQVAVYVLDAWPHDTAILRRYRSAWELCDRVFVGFPEAVPVYEQFMDCPVTYLPVGIHAGRLSPHRTDRPIHVASIGRRLPAVHAKLLDLAQRHDLFYFYSETEAPDVIDIRESQLLLARIEESARVQVCWPVETTSPERARGISPITVRWFEAAACASVVVGARPRSGEFDRLFPYDEFVVPLDPDSEIDDVVLAVSEAAAPSAERLALAEHVRRHHSWSARWETIRETMGHG